MERVEELATRARWSALLPRLRLRATRLLDESSSLSPTSYDPDRVTTRGGASLWLEARGTWDLDRLVFATEEVSVERLRQALIAEQRSLDEQVVEQLYRWQGAIYRARDPLAAPERCLQDWLLEQQLEASLDLLTGGWFARWLRPRRPALPPCLQPPAGDQAALIGSAPPSGGATTARRRAGPRGSDGRSTAGRTHRPPARASRPDRPARPRG